MYEPEILHLLFVLKLGLNLSNKRSVISGNEQIIHIQKKQNNRGALLENVEVAVGLTANPRGALEKTIDFAIPYMWTLFESINGATKMTKRCSALETS